MNLTSIVTDAFSCVKSAVLSAARPLVAVAAILTAGYSSTGCRATHYPMPEAWQQTHERKIRHDFKGRLEDFTAKEFASVLGKDAVEAKIKVVQSDYKESDGLRDKAKNALDAVEYDALTEILKQNKSFSAMNTGLGIQRYVIEIADNNIEYKGLRIAPLSTDEMSNAVYTLFADLAGSMRATKYEDRKKLLDAVADKKCDAFREDLNKIIQFNADNLELYRALTLTSGCLEYIEGNFVFTRDDLQLSSEMSKELTGRDVFADGQKAISKIKGMKLGDFVDPSSPLGEKHKLDMPFEAFYMKELEAVAKEAKSWSWDSKDNIAQDQMYFTLNALMQAYRKGVLDEDEFEGAQRVVFRDIVSRIGESIPKDPGLNAGAIVMSVLPGSSLYKLIASISPAFTSNYFSPADKDRLQAFTKAVREGHARVYGFNNAENFNGSNTPALMTFIISGLSTAGQVVTGGVLIYSAVKGASSDNGGSASSTPSTLGGSGTGGSGTQN